MITVKELEKVERKSHFDFHENYVGYTNKLDALVKTAEIKGVKSTEYFLAKKSFEKAEEALRNRK